MGQYFDNTFFRFLFGFLAIIFISLALLFVTRYFEENRKEKEIVDRNQAVNEFPNVNF